MNAKAIAAATALAVFAFSPAAHADMMPGGMFQKIDGAFYKSGATRSNLGAGSYASRSQNRVAKKARKKRTRTASLTKTYATPRRSGVGPRPRRWCGWWMRTQLGGGPEFNVAWNWRKYGRPTSAQVGAVVIWRHHVGIITGRTANGRWIVKSGNDSNRVRERPRSVKGAVFRI